MRILYSPFSVSKPVFWALMLLGLCLFLFGEWESRRNGIPQIEQAVRLEAASLSHTDELLRSLELGRITRSSYSVYHDGRITGYIQFDGSYSNESWDIGVSWSKADTNALIDKITVGSTYQEPKIIWSRK